MTRFKESREKAGYTQKEAAINLDVSVQAVSYWETGSRMPSVDKILQMCDLYNVSADYLLGRTAPEGNITHGDPPPKPEGKTRVQIKLDPSATPEERIQALVALMVEEELKKRGL